MTGILTSRDQQVAVPAPGQLVTVRHSCTRCAGAVASADTTAPQAPFRSGIQIEEVHNPADTDEEIRRLREVHTEIDYATAQAYGWDDLALGHGFTTPARVAGSHRIGCRGAGPAARTLTRFQRLITPAAPDALPAEVVGACAGGPPLRFRKVAAVLDEGWLSMSSVRWRRRQTPPVSATPLSFHPGHRSC